MPTSVEVSRLFDSTLDRVGFPLDHPYIEQVYCSLIGPTSVLLLRRVGELLDQHPNGIAIDLVDLSRSLGVGPRTPGSDVGRNAPVLRSMDRLVRYELATWLDENRLGVHPKVPAVSKHRVARFATPVQAMHQRLLSNHLTGLVAFAEGREREPASRGSLEESASDLRLRTDGSGSDVAARLRAFGTNGHEPHEVAR